MYFCPPLAKARLIKRYKRFLADIVKPEGEEMTIYCPNTGAMTGMTTPGATIYYSLSHVKKRKYPATWELVQVSEAGKLGWVGVNTHRANQLVGEALREGRICPLTGYSAIHSEVIYKRGARMDFMLAGEKPCYIEVKSLTLAVGKGLGLFPDAPTERGRKHLRVLTEMARRGLRAVLIFCVQHSLVNQVRAAWEIDPAYARLLQEAYAQGVEVYAYAAELSPEGARLGRALPLLALDGDTK